MSKQENRTEWKTISKFVRKPSSANGNPRYALEFADGTSAVTPVDGQIGYKVSGYYEGKKVIVTFNGRGQVVDFEE